MTEVTDSDIEAAEELLNLQYDEIDKLQTVTLDDWMNPVQRTIPNFQGQCGLQITISNEDILSPISLFNLFVTEGMIENVVLETNSYASKFYS